jgi:putative endonuclease
MKVGYIYILTNFTNTTFYIGVTNDLERRINEHKSGFVDGFSKKYKLTKLIYYEEYSSIEDAIAREKQLKNWHRDWKINQIKTMNPDFKDLAEEL